MAPRSDDTSWASGELDRIAEADELRVAPARPDGTLHNSVTIWVVRDGDEIYVRSAYGTESFWYRRATATHHGRIWAGGVEKDVAILDADDTVNDAVDRAYRGKYGGRYASIVDDVVSSEIRATTFRLVPQA